MPSLPPPLLHFPFCMWETREAGPSSAAGREEAVSCPPLHQPPPATGPTHLSPPWPELLLGLGRGNSLLPHPPLRHGQASWPWCWPCARVWVSVSPSVRARLCQLTSFQPQGGTILTWAGAQRGTGRSPELGWEKQRGGSSGSPSDQELLLWRGPSMTLVRCRAASERAGCSEAQAAQGYQQGHWQGRVPTGRGRGLQGRLRALPGTHHASPSSRRLAAKTVLIPVDFLKSHPEKKRKRKKGGKEGCYL